MYWNSELTYHSLRQFVGLTAGLVLISGSVLSLGPSAQGDSPGQEQAPDCTVARLTRLSDEELAKEEDDCPQQVRAEQDKRAAERAEKVAAAEAKVKEEAEAEAEAKAAAEAKAKEEAEAKAAAEAKAKEEAEAKAAAEAKAKEEAEARTEAEAKAAAEAKAKAATGASTATGGARESEAPEDKDAEDGVDDSADGGGEGSGKGGDRDAVRAQEANGDAMVGATSTAPEPSTSPPASALPTPSEDPIIDAMPGASPEPSPTTSVPSATSVPSIDPFGAADVAPRPSASASTTPEDADGSAGESDSAADERDEADPARVAQRTPAATPPLDMDTGAGNGKVGYITVTKFLVDPTDPTKEREVAGWPFQVTVEGASNSPQTIGSGQSIRVLNRNGATVTVTDLSGYPITAKSFCERNDDRWGYQSGSGITVSKGMTGEGQSDEYFNCVIYDGVPSTLTLSKELDGAAPDSPGDFTVSATGTTISYPSNATGQISAGIEYSLTESSATADLNQYETTWQCTYSTPHDGASQSPTSTNTVTVQPGESATCTAINRYVRTTLTLEKRVQPNGTGDQTKPGAFNLSAGGNISGATGSDAVTDVTVLAGTTYDLSESGPGIGTTPVGYESAWVCLDATGGDVTFTSAGANGTVTPTRGQDITCTVTNTAVPPTLTLVKKVSGAQDVAASNWELTATASGEMSGITVPGDENGRLVPGVRPGVYALSEDLTEEAPAEYASQFQKGKWICDNVETDGTVALSLGSDVTCTITNSARATLTLTKLVDDESLTEEARNTIANAFTLSATPSAGGTAALTGKGMATGLVAPGGYLLAEKDLAGAYPNYVRSTAGWVCSADGATDPVPVPVANDIVSLEPGQNVSCVLTNIYAETTLTLTKDFTEETLGDPAEWTLTATPSVSGKPPVEGTSPVTGPVEVGAVTYTLTEDSPSIAHYTLQGWMCENRTGQPRPATKDKATGAWTVGPFAAGDTVTCTATNDSDVGGQLILRKKLSIPGMTKPIDAPGWTFDYELGTGNNTTKGTATTSTDGSVSVPLDKDTGARVNVTETSMPGYLLETVMCTRAKANGKTDVIDWEKPNTLSRENRSIEIIPGVTGAGDILDCTFTNTAPKPRLLLQKTVAGDVTGSGRTAAEWEKEFTLTAAIGGSVHNFKGAAAHEDIEAGTYDLSEAPSKLDSVFSDGGWTCEAKHQRTGTTSDPYDKDTRKVTIEPEQDVTCTKTNNYNPPLLTLKKKIEDPDKVSTASEDDWTVTATPQDLTEPQQTLLGSPLSDKIEMPGGTKATAKPALSGVTYVLSEAPDPTKPTLTKQFSHVGWSCTVNGVSITPANPNSEAGTAEVTIPKNGDDVICTVTNKAVLPSLTLVKKVVKTGVAPAAPEDSWVLSAQAGGAAALTAVGSDTGTTHKDVAPDTYTLSEAVNPAKPQPAGSHAVAWECTGQSGAFTYETGDPTATVRLGLGDNVTCTATNSAVAPTLAIVKHVNDPSGRSGATSADWTLSAVPTDTSLATTISMAGPGGTTGHPAVAGMTYDLSESTSVAGLADQFKPDAWVCRDKGAGPNLATVPAGAEPGTAQLTPQPGQKIVCEITNSAVLPSLTLVKHTVGTGAVAAAPADSWQLSAQSGGADALTVTGSEGGETLSDLAPGSYTLSEAANPATGEPPAGYELTDWQCTGQDGAFTYTAGEPTATVDLALGDHVTCTATNSAAAPTLTLSKALDDPSGTSGAQPQEWTLVATPKTAIGGAIDISMTGDSDVGAAAAAGVDYTLSEEPGSEALSMSFKHSGWTCTAEGSSQNLATAADIAAGTAHISLMPGQNVTCVATNTAVDPALTLVKKVETLEGVPVTTPADWQLSAIPTAGATLAENGASGSALTARAGVTYTLSDLPAATLPAATAEQYELVSWSCTGGTFVAGPPATITMRLGEKVTCTATNRAVEYLLETGDTLFGVGDTVWHDRDHNGRQDLGEPGVPQVLVSLLTAEEDPVVDDFGNPIQAVTDANGKYLFDGVAAGEYRVGFSGLPEDAELTVFQAPGVPRDASSRAVANGGGTGITPVFALNETAEQVIETPATLATQVEAAMVDLTEDAGLHIPSGGGAVPGGGPVPGGSVPGGGDDFGRDTSTPITGTTLPQTGGADLLLQLGIVAVLLLGGIGLVLARQRQRVAMA